MSWEWVDYSQIDMSTLPAKETCRATSKESGERCKRYPRPGSMVCMKHGGNAKQVRDKARERLMAGADSASRILIELMEDKKVPHAVRLNAARDLLDRAGLGASQKVEVEVRKYEQLIDAGELVVDVGPQAALEQPGVEDAEIVEESDYQAELDELI